jgi:hypothetical protein
MARPSAELRAGIPNLSHADVAAPRLPRCFEVHPEFGSGAERPPETAGLQRIERALAPEECERSVVIAPERLTQPFDIESAFGHLLSQEIPGWKALCGLALRVHQLSPPPPWAGRVHDGGGSILVMYS